MRSALANAKEFIGPAGRLFSIMFTGIVEETGIVERIRPAARAIELTVLSKVCGKGLRLGDSLAVNGCCLTVVKLASRANAKLIQFDLLEETWQRTNFQFAQAGSRVNLERALRADGRLGGHFVTGHIDGTGKIARWEPAGRDRVLEIAAPSHLLRQIVFKGSIAVDGISLTVAAASKGKFRVWIIPHTYQATALCQRQAGDLVNLETDLLGKYVARFATFGADR